MKCRIQWIDKDGRRTPDDNDAVAMAHFHRPIWEYPGGNPENRIVGYAAETQQSFPICAKHLEQAKGPWSRPLPGWSFTPLGEAPDGPK